MDIYYQSRVTYSAYKTITQLRKNQSKMYENVLYYNQKEGHKKL
jgi:hypothetical protein